MKVLRSFPTEMAKTSGELLSRILSRFEWHFVSGFDDELRPDEVDKSRQKM